MKAKYGFPAEFKDQVTINVIAGLIIAIVMQGLAVYFVFNQFLVFALIFHVLSACLFPWPLWNLMPNQYRNDRAIFGFIFLMCLLIPLVSGIGLLLTLCLASHFAKTFEEDVTATTDVPMLPVNLIQIMQISQYERGGGVLGVLETSSIEEQRIQAVLKTRQMPDPEAIPILKVALLDPVDEVRLLAYSMLNKKEKNIDRMIHFQQQKLVISPLVKKIKVHLRLAEAYWELSYLGLAQGQAQTQILQDAYRHIQHVLSSKPTDADAFFLQARITLALGVYDVADESLNRALKFGKSQSHIKPYREELMFAMRFLNQIDKQASHPDDTPIINKLAPELSEQWSE